MGDVMWWLVVPLFPLVLPLLPDGHLWSRRSRPLFGAGLISWLSLGMSIAFEPRLGGLSDTPSAVENPLAIPGLGDVLKVVGRVAMLGLIVVLVTAVVSLGFQWRLARGRARRRLVWLSLPAIIGGGAILASLAWGAGENVASQLGLIMFLVALPLAVCATVFIDDLPGVDQFAGPVVVYGVVATVLTGAYVLLALSVGSLIHGSGDDLGVIIATAVCTVSLVEELQASRAGLVDAIEDERRRIRRDLHDGLGPAMAGIGLGLETLANLAVTETPDFRIRLARVREDVATVYDDLRFLARGLRPPALGELGLMGALRSQAGRLAGSDGALQIRICIDGDPHSVVSLPAAVELAAYHVAVEALTNVVRHAGATSCAVTLRRGQDLWLEISDNGRGIASRPAGVGLLSMRERCEQLGGRLDLAQTNGAGTLVTAWLPIR